MSSLMQSPLKQKRENSPINSPNNLVIARIWHERTLNSQADEYYRYLHQEGIEE
ncbi:MAG: hypothetical protein MUD14_29995 [Hydrococcus sp. Prado102]|nr:hypothetical protein [Hydrococcus sp. Prado102]